MAGPRLTSDLHAVPGPARHRRDRSGVLEKEGLVRQTPPDSRNAMTPMRLRLPAALFATTALLAGCTSELSGPDRPSSFSASVTGSVQSEYHGDGTFRLLPPGRAGPRFSLHSRGSGSSSEQGFAFLAMDAIAVGEHPVGEIDATTVRASFWYDEGQTRRIFRAGAGTLLVTEASERRLAGSFSITATLVLTCSVAPGFPGPILDCAPDEGDRPAEITGTFDAGPLGGASPGLIPS